MASVTCNPEVLPNDRGAYLLLIRLKQPVLLPRRFAGQVLPIGCYGYAGSAYGPGGIRARCRRHLGGRGKCHWHIDWLTRSAVELQAIGFPQGSECDLIHRLTDRDLGRFPVMGFGSTDCRQCPAHLVQFDQQGSRQGLTVELLQYLTPR